MQLRLILGPWRARFGRRFCAGSGLGLCLPTPRGTNLSSRLLGLHAIIPTHSVESAPMLRRAGFKPGRIILRLAH